MVLRFGLKRSKLDPSAIRFQIQWKKITEGTHLPQRLLSHLSLVLFFIPFLSSPSIRRTRPILLFTWGGESYIRSAGSISTCRPLSRSVVLGMHQCDAQEWKFANESGYGYNHRQCRAHCWERGLQFPVCVLPLRSAVHGNPSILDQRDA